MEGCALLRPTASTSGSAVGSSGHVEAKLMREAITHLASDRGIRDELCLTAYPIGGDPLEVDAPHLVAENQALPRLAGVTQWQPDLARVFRIPRGDGTHLRHAAPVKGLIADNQRSPSALLFVPLGRIEIDDDN
jgi:hypothetical protein